MKKSAKALSLAVLTGLLMASGTVPAANAANLKARSPVISPATGYPTWYQDNNNLALELCLDPNGFCILDPTTAPLPANRADITPANFSGESFYFNAETLGADPTGTISLVVYVAALEAGFASDVVADGNQAAFTRVRIRVNVTVPGTYTVTHPYGVETFDVATIIPGPEINASFDVPGLVAGLFDLALTSKVGPFLTKSDGTFVTDPTTGNRYLGNPATPVTVTGSPFGTNFVRIEGPTATFETNTFSLMGKVIGMDVVPGSKLDLGRTNIVTPAALPRTVTVTNTTGNSITFVPDLNAVGVKGGTDAGDFLIMPPTQLADPAAVPLADCAGATVNPGATCSFDVTFPLLNKASVAARTATLLLAPLSVQPLPPTPAVADPPPVTLNLSGTAQVTVTALGQGHGSITPETQDVDAGSIVTFTVAPSNSKFKVKDVAEGTALVAPSPTDATVFTMNAGAVNHAVIASFMPSGDLDANGKLEIADAMKALKIVAGIQAADSDDPDNTAVNVAPLVGGIPSPDANIDIGDVLVILRKVLSLDAW